MTFPAIFVIIQLILIWITHGKNPVVWAGFAICLVCYLGALIKEILKEVSKKSQPE